MSKPSAEKLMIISAFGQLPTSEKMEVFYDILSELSSDLERFGDPVLTRELDVMDAITTNLDTRLEEIAAIYGQS